MVVRKPPVWSLLAGALAFGFASGPSFVAARAQKPSAASAVCADLTGKNIGGAKIVEAVMVPAQTMEATARAPAGETPAYCKVAALIPLKLRFETRLPVNWNGKLHFTGSGGFGGRIYPVNPAVLAQGYADVSSNTGHDGEGGDISFALDDPTAALQLAQLSVPTVAAATKEIIKAYYGKAPERSYFEGCSNGGREGIMTALRFPTIFDGVIAGAPGIQETAIIAYKQHSFRAILAPGGMINKNKLKMLDQAVLKQCDTVAADGLADGVVSNWEACRFDPASLRCPGGKDAGDHCLSDPQLRSIRALTEPQTFAKGGLTFSGYPLVGTQGLPGQWDSWRFDPNTWQIASLDSAIKYLFAQDPKADGLTWDLEANALALKRVRDLFDVNDPNLHSFMLNGGKLIIWTGAGDPTVALPGVVNYYKDVVGAVGEDKADDFLRLYVLGGVGHCRGGSGADRPGELLSTLDAWATKNRAPENVAAIKTDAETGAPLLSRPMCPYPSYVRYKGEGDPNDPGSFVCAKN